MENNGKETKVNIDNSFSYEDDKQKKLYHFNIEEFTVLISKGRIQ